VPIITKRFQAKRVNWQGFQVVMGLSSCKILSFIQFLANRNNCLAYATVLLPSVDVCLSVTYVSWLNDASYSKSHY